MSINHVDETKKWTSKQKRKSHQGKQHIYIRANFFVSALNTNMMITIDSDQNGYTVYRLKTHFMEYSLSTHNCLRTLTFAELMRFSDFQEIYFCYSGRGES